MNTDVYDVKLGNKLRQFHLLIKGMELYISLPFIDHVLPNINKKIKGMLSRYLHQFLFIDKCHHFVETYNFNENCGIFSFYENKSKCIISFCDASIFYFF